MGLLAMLLTMPVSLCAGAALVTKRLHDLGRSGAHAIWITGAQVAFTFLPNTPDTAAAEAILGLVVIGAAIWPLFVRGEQGPNTYGSSLVAHPASAVAA